MTVTQQPRHDSLVDCTVSVSALMAAGTNHPPLDPLDQPATCAICGNPAAGHGRKEKGPGGIFAGSFTNRDLLANTGTSICGPCAEVASWMTAKPDHPTPFLGCNTGWILADQAITKIPAGTAGLRTLASLAERPPDKPFAVLAGLWGSNKLHGPWMTTPVAYPAGTYLAMWIQQTGTYTYGQRVPINTAKLENVADVADGLGWTKWPLPDPLTETIAACGPAAPLARKILTATDKPKPAAQATNKRKATQQ